MRAEIKMYLDKSTSNIIGSTLQMHLMWRVKHRLYILTISMVQNNKNITQFLLKLFSIYKKWLYNCIIAEIHTKGKRSNATLYIPVHKFVKCGLVLQLH